jgi:hypothetical protein
MNHEDTLGPYGAFLGADWKEVEPGIFVHVADLRQQPQLLQVVSEAAAAASSEVGAAA